MSRAPAVRVKEVAAFTEDPRGGNLAGVVTAGGEKLSEIQMQAIARDVGHSETAFLLPPSAPGADIRIRWFTPSQEVGLCGHATVAAFHAAAEERSWGLGEPGTHRARAETLSGILPVDVIVAPGRPALIRMGLPDCAMEEISDPAPLVAAAGLRHEQLASPPAALRGGMYALLALRRLADLHAVRPRMREVAAALDLLGGPDGLILSCLETLEPASAVHLRMFAPGAGVAEDPVTGSAQGPVAGWLAMIGFFAGSGRGSRFRDLGGGRLAFVSEQGDVMGRRGRIGVELTAGSGHGSGAAARDVVISGSAVTVAEEDRLLPPE